MEAKTDSPKVPDMVMCGDHPSFTKTELNAKEPWEEKEALALPSAKLSSTSTREDKPAERRARAGPRRRALPAPAPAHAPDAQGGALVQAALGSFRWPPYLLAVWVLVLVLTHALHCLVSCLERALPRLRGACACARGAAERLWAGPGARAPAAALGALAALLYCLYFALYLVYSVALWAVEPLAQDDRDEGARDTKVTDYTDDDSRTDASLK